MPPNSVKAVRWHAVTINKPPAEVAPDGVLPEPLRRLGDSVEVRFNEAPGDRGTEVYARLRGGEPAGPASLIARLTEDDPRWAVRRALREAKQILETGEVLRAHEPPTTRRTLRNRPLEYATRHGREEGRL
jgi:uncharacterized membrane protein